jgi:CBS domain-containing protein
MREAKAPVRQLLGEPPWEVFSVAPDVPVLAALEVLADKDLGALVVLDEGRLAGVFSERDYARGGELAGRSAQDTPVRELMTPDVIFVTPDQTVEQCMALMTAKRMRHLPVMERDEVVGLVSIGDLVKQVNAHYEDVVRDLERDQMFLRTGEAGYY